MKRLFLAAAAVALAGAPAVAAACSAPPEARTNLQLVAEAETIVLARVIGGTARADGSQESSIIIRPLEAVKGELPQGDIALRGMSLPIPRRGTVWGYQLSNPYEFERAHPIAYAGSCNRDVFPLGTTVLFFLRGDHEGMWAGAEGGPFTRWAEDVPDADAPWVQLVKLYTIAAGLPEADRAPFLEDEREALMARTGEPLAQLMADDIARQLGRPDAASDDAFEDAFRDPSEESAVEAALRAMRQSGVEAGN